MFQDFFDDVSHWCRGKIWYFRAIVLLFFLYIFLRHLANPMYNSIFKGLNLGIHELGHFVFVFFGRFIEIAGGTILQLLVPLIAIFMFYKQRDYFAIAFSFGWLSTNLFDVATYIADARARALPLVSPGSSEYIIHDWNYLLRRMGLLKMDTTIAFFTRVLAVVSMLICLGFGTWIILKMIQLDDTPKFHR